MTYYKCYINLDENLFLKLWFSHPSKCNDNNESYIKSNIKDNLKKYPNDKFMMYWGKKHIGWNRMCTSSFSLSEFEEVIDIYDEIFDEIEKI